MLLYINTADAQQVRVAVKDGEAVICELTDANAWGSQILLPLIERVMKEAKIGWDDLEAVEVETGPGSYTGVRVGVSVANAIGLGKHILVNGKPFETDIKYS
jgi:tRNA threonylcarbamoyladenosine biosynthesis protein TsaB